MNGQYLRYGTVVGKITVEGGLTMAVIRQQGFEVTAWIPWIEDETNRVIPGHKYTLSKNNGTYILGQRIATAA